MRGSLLFGLCTVVAVHACERVGADRDRDREAPPAASRQERPDCVVDADCALMPAVMSCCGECDPVPPFEAVPRSEIDARLLELETTCAETSRVCEAPTCGMMPPGCVAEAICVLGHCRVLENGCSGYVAWVLQSQ